MIAGAAGLIAEKSFAPYAIAGAATLFHLALQRSRGPHVLDHQEQAHVSHFMNKFRKFGFIDYNGHL